MASSCPDAPLDVAIIGAGIGGCALARFLRYHCPNLSVRLFEHDPAFDSRPQGYSLTLQQASTVFERHQSVKAKLGLPAHLLEALEREDCLCEAHLVFEKSGRLLGGFGAAVAEAAAERHQLLLDEREQRERAWIGGAAELCSKEGAPSLASSACSRRRNLHIGRQRLRELLYLGSGEKEDADPLPVQWGCRFVGLCGDESEAAEFTSFRLLDEASTDEKVVRARLVVGADGIRSGVRRAMTTGQDHLRVKMADGPDPLRYQGVLVLLGICEDEKVLQATSESLHDAAESQFLVQRMTYQTVSEGVRLFVMPFNEHKTFWQLSFRYSEEELAAARNTLWSPDRSERGLERKRLALDKVGGWHEPCGALISASRVEDIEATPVYERERDVSELVQGRKVGEQHANRVTLIGDALHPMTPFKGQGANQAMLDAVELGRLIATGKPSGFKRLQTPRERRHGLRPKGVELDEAQSHYLDLASGSADSVCRGLRAFEKRMEARAESKVLESRRLLKETHFRTSTNGNADAEDEGSSTPPSTEYFRLEGRVKRDLFLEEGEVYARDGREVVLRRARSMLADRRLGAQD